MREQDLSLYYDELHRWTRKDESFQVYSGFENDTIHRFLIDPDSGQFSPDTIYRFMDPYLAEMTALHGLDAGCGYGGSCFRYYRVLGGHWTGITISREQCEHARKIAYARGLDRAVDFHLLSYDDRLPGRYNVVIAIESLIHSADPLHTMRNLVSVLEGGGRLLIADDMPLDTPSEPDRAVLEDFKTAWRCPVAPSAAMWVDCARQAGLALVAEEDMSHRMRPRPEADLDAAHADLSSQRTAKAKKGFARLSDAEIGGLALERLHGRGAVRYVLLVFEKR